MLSPQEGFYGWHNQDNQLITHIALPTFLDCNRDGRLSGCLFEFDNPSRQCRDSREGELGAERREGGSGREGRADGMEKGSTKEERVNGRGVAWWVFEN